MKTSQKKSLLNFCENFYNKKNKYIEQPATRLKKLGQAF